MSLSPELEGTLIAFSKELINQHAARRIVSPQKSEPGYWFGGGNLTQGPDGNLYLVGRYRDSGDSRTGTQAGTRGHQLVILRSENGGWTFSTFASWGKEDLASPGRPVLSIEGSALSFDSDGVELYISVERENVGYPQGFEEYLKPGTGVWSIERLSADTIDDLQNAAVEPFLSSDQPHVLHVKDPFLYQPANGAGQVFFCSHPYCWSSSNTGHISRHRAQSPHFEVFPRGPAWDVAICRGTCILDVPSVGAFTHRQVSLLFYDGGESVRCLDQHAQAVKRPRGYSCEELGGVAYFSHGDLTDIRRLSQNAPLFVSPWGTGCSRYVDVLKTDLGLFATWQQSQPDGSQALVMHTLSNDEIEQLLA